jgi:hypothetical protein
VGQILSRMRGITDREAKQRGNLDKCTTCGRAYVDEIPAVNFEANVRTEHSANVTSMRRDIIPGTFSTAASSIHASVLARAITRTHMNATTRTVQAGHPKIEDKRELRTVLTRKRTVLNKRFLTPRGVQLKSMHSRVPWASPVTKHQASPIQL